MQAYGRGVTKIIETANSDTITERQCSGYGVYMASGRNPEGDVLAGSMGAYGLFTGALNTEARVTDPFKAACDITSNSVSDGAAWRCVKKAAEYFMEGKASINMPIRTAVVSMGRGVNVGESFGFYDVDSRTDFPSYTTTTTLQSIDQRYQEILGSGVVKNPQQPLLNDRRYAMHTGVVGGGGYYAVSNVTALKQSIDEFIIKTLRVDIPYITTGAPTIPQDLLNPALVQNDAYYSQFKPTPSAITTDGSQLWAGNMKKYHVDNWGRLIGKNDDVIDDLGRLVNGTHDFWAPPVSSDAVLRRVMKRSEEVNSMHVWGARSHNFL